MKNSQLRIKIRDLKGESYGNRCLEGHEELELVQYKLNKLNVQMEKKKLKWAIVINDARKMTKLKGWYKLRLIVSVALNIFLIISLKQQAWLVVFIFKLLEDN